VATGTGYIQNLRQNPYLPLSQWGDAEASTLQPGTHPLRLPPLWLLKATFCVRSLEHICGCSTRNASLDFGGVGVNPIIFRAK